MKRILLSSAVLILLWMGNNAAAQSIGPSTLNMGGGSTTIAGNTYEWNIGEMAVVATYESGTLVVTQGLLQPKDGPTGVASLADIPDLRVFPNPASNELHLTGTALNNGSLGWKMLDVTGRLIASASVPVQKGAAFSVTIPMSQVSPGQYVLSVQQDHKAVQSFTIQKIQ